MGKFTDSFRQTARASKKLRMRQQWIRAFPWYDGKAEEITVTDSLNPGKVYTAEILSVTTGYNVGLMFELAPRKLIKDILCPKCGETATLNIHWQGFKCIDAMWEVVE